MNVIELIDRLEAMPQGATVLFWNEYEESHDDINNVRKDDDGDVVLEETE